MLMLVWNFLGVQTALLQFRTVL